MTKEVALAEIDLSGCPEGIVFDPTDADWNIEDAYMHKACAPGTSGPTFRDWKCGSATAGTTTG